MALMQDETPRIAAQQGWLGQALDPQFAMPVRLFIATLLTEMKWRDFRTVCEAVDVKRSAFEYHLGILLREKIVQTRRGQGRRMWVRLTPDGAQRLLSHLEATQAIVARATELLATAANRPDIGPPGARQRKSIERASVTPEDQARLAGSYEAGATIEALAKESGLSYRATRTALIAARVTLRPPKIQVPSCPPGLVNMYQHGASIRAVATRYELSYNQTRNMLLQASVTLRPPGQPSNRW
jgi:DNA-binding transcriptional ArsR family regulator/lambda repressor-like predicted transcriptional regulator